MFFISKGVKGKLDKKEKEFIGYFLRHLKRIHHLNDPYVTRLKLRFGYKLSLTPALAKRWESLSKLEKIRVEGALKDIRLKLTLYEQERGVMIVIG